MPFRAFINDRAEVELPSMQAASRWQAWKEGHVGAEIIIDERKATRSLFQNAYYWAYLNIIANETGDNASALHELFKRELLPPRFIKARGREFKIPGSTKELDKLQ